MPEHQPTGQMSRELAARFRCPKCKADPGAPCQGRSGPRVSNHQARIQYALKQLGMPANNPGWQPAPLQQNVAKTRAQEPPPGGA